MRKDTTVADYTGQQFGNYRLIRLLGRGGFADTYLGEHLYLKTSAAIKVLQGQLAQTDQEAFYTEARTIAHLKHPNIVRVLEFGVDGTTPYLVMEYAPNGTLRQRHPRGVPLSPATILPYVKHLAAALQCAHDQHLVHRDVKPENMLLGATNEVLLSDFGIATIAQNTRSQNPQNVAGTVAYMAPEQIQGKPRPASDQYALGVVIYEWLCGTPPFTGTYLEVALQHERSDPPPLRSRIPTLAPDIEQVVLTALAKDPRSRFGSVQAFANAFEQACAQQPAAQTAQLVPDPQEFASTVVSMYQQTPLASSASQGPQTSYGVPSSYMSQNAPFNQPNPYGPQPTPQEQQNPYAPQPLPPNQSEPYAPQQTPSGPQNPAYMPQFTPPNPYQPNPYAPQSAPTNYPNPATPPPMAYMPPPSTQPNPQTQPVMSFAPPSLVQSAQAPTPVQPGQPPAQPRRSPTSLVILVVALVVLLIGGGALIYYSTVYQPNRQHAFATATSSAKTAVVQSTSEARIHATATSVASATAVVVATQTALQQIYTQATTGTPAITDSLSQQDSYNWSEFGSTTSGCAFSGGSYYAGAASGYITPCFAKNSNFGNFAYQVQMTILSGQSAGIIFRGDFSRDNYYQFRINTDGTYFFSKTYTDSSNIANDTPLTSGSSPAIKTGLNQANLITVVAQGNTFHLYINKQYVDQASNGDYTNGQVGVFSVSSTGTAEAMFTNAQVWKL